MSIRGRRVGAQLAPHGVCEGLIAQEAVKTGRPHPEGLEGRAAEAAQDSVARQDRIGWRKVRVGGVLIGGTQGCGAPL